MRMPFDISATEPLLPRTVVAKSPRFHLTLWICAIAAAMFLGGAFLASQSTLTPTRIAVERNGAQLMAAGRSARDGGAGVGDVMNLGAMLRGSKQIPRYDQPLAVSTLDTQVKVNKPMPRHNLALVTSASDKQVAISKSKLHHRPKHSKMVSADNKAADSPTKNGKSDKIVKASKRLPPHYPSFAAAATDKQAKANKRLPRPPPDHQTLVSGSNQVAEISSKPANKEKHLPPHDPSFVAATTGKHVKANKRLPQPPLDHQNLITASNQVAEIPSKTANNEKRLPPHDPSLSASTTDKQTKGNKRLPRPPPDHQKLVSSKNEEVKNSAKTSKDSKRLPPHDPSFAATTTDKEAKTNKRLPRPPPDYQKLVSSKAVLVVKKQASGTSQARTKFVSSIQAVVLRALQDEASPAQALRLSLRLPSSPHHRLLECSKQAADRFENYPHRLVEAVTWVRATCLPATKQTT